MLTKIKLKKLWRTTRVTKLAPGAVAWLGLAKIYMQLGLKGEAELNLSNSLSSSPMTRM